MTDDLKRAQELADLSVAAEAMAAEVERAADRLLTKCRELRFEAGNLATMAETEAPRRVSRNRWGDEVDEALAVRSLRDLCAEHGRPATRRELAARMGVTPSGVGRWITRLTDRQHPVAERLEDGTIDYRDPATHGFASSGPSSRPDHAAAVEAAAEVGADAPARGGPAVPYTRAVGRSGRPGYDRKRARQGAKVKTRNKK